MATQTSSFYAIIVPQRDNWKRIRRVFDICNKWKRSSLRIKIFVQGNAIWLGRIGEHYAEWANDGAWKSIFIPRRNFNLPVTSPAPAARNINKLHQIPTLRCVRYVDGGNSLWDALKTKRCEFVQGWGETRGIRYVMRRHSVRETFLKLTRARAPTAFVFGFFAPPASNLAHPVRFYYF